MLAIRIDTADATFTGDCRLVIALDQPLNLALHPHQFIDLFPHLDPFLTA
jgi:hypothetical protein